MAQWWLSKQFSGKPFWHREPALQPGKPGDQLQFDLVGERPWPGWNMIELHVDEGAMYGVAIILVETRHKKFQLGIPVQPGKIAKRLVFIPLGVKRISLATSNASNTLKMKRLRWVWLTPWFAHDRLARRLSSIHPDYKGMGVSEVKRALHRESVARGCRWKSVALAEHTQTFMRASTQYSYTHWISNVEPDLCRLTENWLCFDKETFPTFAILLPLHEVEFERVGMAGLKQTLLSLMAQSYSKWEVSIALPATLNAKQVAAIRLLAHNICASAAYVSLCQQASLAALTRHAFIQSFGEGTLFLSPGDILAPQALSRVADAWLEAPSCQLFYADEDVVDNEERRSQPSFKPEWNPDLLLSTHYVGRMTVYKRRILWRLEVYQEIGGRVRSDMRRDDLDYARALRFLAWLSQRETSTVGAVKHLPWMLYHRHIAHHEADQKRSDHTPSLVEDWVQLVLPGCNARVSNGQLPFSAHVRWPLGERPPLVSLLVPTRDGVDILRPCVDRILQLTSYRHFELLILDNQSTCPQTLAYLADVEARDSRVRVLRWNHPFNYSAINNFGVRHANGDIIGMVNNDIEPINGDWLSEMVGQVLRPDIGCVGAKLYYPNGTLQHGGVILGLGGVAGHAHRFFPRQAEGYCGRLKLTQNLTAVTGACLLVRRDVFEEVGGLNEQKLAVTFNDVDLCLKVYKAGYRNLWTPYAELYHHESISRGADNTPKKRTRRLREMAYMRRTWSDLLNHDPAYNPNLTLAYEDFSLR
ncbi:glycosyltransferase family 2 protein [Halomonas sp. CH40]